MKKTTKKKQNPADKDLELLKQLLLADELSTLGKLQQRITNREKRLEDLVDGLPDALNAITDSNNREVLDRVLYRAMSQMIRNDPKGSSELLYPVILPSIRKAVSESMQSTIEKIDRMIKSKMSVEKLKWRIESLKKGIPYSEYVLRKAIDYRTEEIYLIHKPSGLLINHIHKNEVTKDSDAVSAMLVAIENFASSSFSNDGDNIQRMTLGGKVVYIAHGAYAVLACVVVGVAPVEFREKIQDILERIHLQHVKKLKHYSGDKSEFDDVTELLSECLHFSDIDKT